MKIAKWIFKRLNPITRLLWVLEDLKWNIAMPKIDDDDEIIPGFIIGESEYIDKVLSYLPEDIEWLQKPKD